MASQAKKTKEANYRMVRIPVALAEALDTEAVRLLEAYEKGQTDRVRITEQGSRGSWVSLAEVIRLGLEELTDHRERSRKSRKGRKTQETTVETLETVEAA